MLQSMGFERVGHDLVTELKLKVWVSSTSFLGKDFL